MKHLVIGSGEVGTAIASVIEADSRDIEPFEGSYDVLHICFGWFDGFEEAVRQYQRQHNAQYVVVHSTVPVGTCDRNGWTHSPVRGRYPNLFEGVLVFTKHFGGANAEEMSKVFSEAGVLVSIHESAATTEAGKLVELAQFGVEVAMQKEIRRLCKEWGVPFDEVYTEFGNTYNDGYECLGEYRFLKPVLRYVEGPLGGHCVAQNTPLIGSEFFDRIVGPVSPEGWDGTFE